MYIYLFIILCIFSNIIITNVTSLLFCYFYTCVLYSLYLHDMIYDTIQKTDYFSYGNVRLLFSK